MAVLNQSAELPAILRKCAEWAEANMYEVPIILPDVLNAAAAFIESVLDSMKEE